MAEWIRADQGHIKGLQSFGCVAQKSIWSPGRRKRTSPEQQAQNMVRDLRPGDLTPPDTVLLAMESEQIAAVACLMMEWQASGALHAVVPVMAVHLNWQGQGLGASMLQTISDTVADEWLTRPEIVYAKIEAEVHPENERCKALITRNGWNRVGTADDGLYETWATMLGLED